MKRKYSIIYVDLESLLDIRQAILLSLLTEEEVTEIIFSDNYNFREVEEFPKVTKEQHQLLYSNLNKSLLPKSTITYIINILETKIANLEKRNIYYGETTFPKLLINTYPFNLNEEERNLLRNMIFIKLKNKCEIDIVEMPIDNLSPYFIKSNNIITIFMYKFNDWLSKHTEALNNLKLPNTIFYFPSLLAEKPSSEDLVKIKKYNYNDIFSFMEFFYSGVTSINFLPIFFYSNLIVANTVIKKNKKLILNLDLGDTEHGNISTKV